MSILTGVTGSIGGTELFAAGCFTGTAAVSGAAVGMVVTVTPRTFPGNGITWQGYVSAANLVTVKVCSTIAAFIGASIYDVQVNDASGGPSLPQIVAAVNLNAQTGPNTLVLVDGTQPTGDYLLCDYLEVLTADATSAMDYEVTWTDETGTVNPGANVSATDVGSFSLYAACTNFALVTNGPHTAPTLIRALTGHAVTVNLGIEGFAIGSISVSSGQGGALWAPKDTFSIDSGDGTAIGVVDTVDGGGAVLTCHVDPANRGSSYTVSTDNPTTAIVPAAGTGLEVDINTVASNVSYNYHATLMRLQ